MIPKYEQLEVSRCKKCGKIIAEPKELIRIHERYARAHVEGIYPMAIMDREDFR